jgi:hypothetical protein
MIFERNRSVGSRNAGSLKDSPLSFWIRMSPPVFILKAGIEAPDPDAVRKLRAEWIKVRKYGQNR